jgi:heme oxygenase
MALDRHSAPYLAQEEQQRGDNLAQFIANVASEPTNATHDSLPLYQNAARQAFETAARFTEQPKGGLR